MRGLKLVEPEMRRIVIQQAIHRAEDARYAHRLHGTPGHGRSELSAGGGLVWRGSPDGSTLGEDLRKERP